MKRKIFFQQSGLYWFFISLLFIILSWFVFGVVYCSISVFMENEETLTNYIAIFGGILGFLLFGFELLRMVRQVIILKDNEIYVPEEWGMSDEKFQHEVSILYTEMDHVFLRETTCDSNNNPVKRYWLTLPNIYFVMCCKNGKEKSINILFYSKKCRIKMINEIINRAKLCGNDFTHETGEEIYNTFVVKRKEEYRELKEKRKNKRRKK